MVKDLISVLGHINKKTLGLFLRVCGEGRIRTSEGLGRQIYSLLRLTAPQPPRFKEAEYNNYNNNMSILISSKLVFWKS